MLSCCSYLMDGLATDAGHHETHTLNLSLSRSHPHTQSDAHAAMNQADPESENKRVSVNVVETSETSIDYRSLKMLVTHPTDPSAVRLPRQLP